MTKRGLREPQPGGLIERFFKTTQSQFEAEVRATKLLSLSELNRAFAAWLETAYHQQVHCETKQPPHPRYFTEKKIFRPLAIGSILPIFHLCEYRTVHSTFSDVVLTNTFYQVDPKLRGFRVRVDFDPFIHESGLPDRVDLYSEQGVFIGVGRRYQRQLGAHDQPEVKPTKKLDESAYLKTLLQDAEQAQRSQRQASSSWLRSWGPGRC